MHGQLHAGQPSEVPGSTGNSRTSYHEVNSRVPEGISAHEAANTLSSSDAPDASGEKRESLDQEDVVEPEPLFMLSGETLKPNDRLIVARLCEEHPVAYKEAEDQFYTYKAAKGCWLPITKVTLTSMVENFMLKLAKDEDRSLAPMITLQHAKSVVGRIKYDRPMQTPRGPEKCLILVKNGVVDLSGAHPVLLPYSPDYGFTHEPLVEYIPDAAPTRFLRDLLEPAMPDLQDRLLLQRDFGRMLFPDNAAQRIGLVIGKGGSGKSVCLDITERMIGIKNIAYLRTNNLGSRFEVGNFDGKSCLMAKDVPPDFLTTRGAQLLKSLTGADNMQTEKKYGGMSSLRGDFFVVVTANSRLCVKIQGDEEAWRRRLIIHSFSRETVPHRIANLAQVLIEEEGPGILNWHMEGFLRHREELTAHGGIVLTETQQKRVEEVLEESSSPVIFVRDQVAKGKGSLTIEEIYTAYCNYCDERGWQAVSKLAFSTELPILMVAHHGVKRRHDIQGSKRGFKDVAFVTCTEPAANQATPDSASPKGVSRKKALRGTKGKAPKEGVKKTKAAKAQRPDVSDGRRRKAKKAGAAGKAAKGKTEAKTQKKDQGKGKKAKK
jgi:phage/plasmid-associated DNA primase